MAELLPDQLRIMAANVPDEVGYANVAVGAPAGRATLTFGAWERRSNQLARWLIASGVAKGGMTPKLESARLTLERGVARVRIGDFAAIADPSAGTTLLLATAVRRPR